MLVAASIVLLALLLILILKSKFLPGNIMAVLPLAVALIIGTGFENSLIFAHTGIEDVMVVVALFMFASIYFGVMSDVGLFEPLIGRLMRIKGMGKTIFSVVAVTGFISIIAHLDGQGLTTLIVTVPPMLIIFDKLKIRRIVMALIFTLVVGAMNILPWGGPIARTATVINMDVMDIYRKMLPIQIVGEILSFIVLFIVCKQEEKRREFIPATDAAFAKVELSEEEKALRRPKLFWVNFAVTVLLLAALFIGLPPHIGFLIGCAIVLPLNYRTIKEQDRRIKAHAGNILVNCYTIIGAGVLLGIMEGTGMFDALATAIVSVIPESLSGVAHIIFGVLVTPLSILLNTDAIIYGIMPVIVDVGAKMGVAPVTIVAMFVSGRVMATGISITTPSVYLGLALMKIDYKDAFKLVFGWSMALGTIMVLLSAIIVR